MLTAHPSSTRVLLCTGGRQVCAGATVSLPSRAGRAQRCLGAIPATQVSVTKQEVEKEDAEHKTEVRPLLFFWKFAHFQANVFSQHNNFVTRSKGSSGGLSSLEVTAPSNHLTATRQCLPGGDATTTTAHTRVTRPQREPRAAAALANGPHLPGKQPRNPLGPKTSRALLLTSSLNLPCCHLQFSPSA